MTKEINIILKDVEANLSASGTVTNVDVDHTTIPRLPIGYDTAFELKTTLSSSSFGDLIVNASRQIALPGWSRLIQEYITSSDSLDIPEFERQQDYFLEDYVDFSYVESTGSQAAPNETFGVFEILSTNFSKVLSESIGVFEDLEKPISNENSEYSNITESQQIAFDKNLSELITTSETLSYALNINFSEDSIIIDSDYSIGGGMLLNSSESNNTSEVVAAHIQNYWADFVVLDYVGSSFEMVSNLLIPNFLSETNTISETLSFEMGIFPSEFNSISETLLFDIGTLPEEFSSTNELLTFQFGSNISSDEINAIYESLLFETGIYPNELNIVNETLSFERGVPLEDLETASESVSLHNQSYILTDAWNPNYTGTTQSI